MKKYLSLLAIGALLFSSCGSSDKKTETTGADDNEPAPIEDINKSGYSLKIKKGSNTYIYTKKGSNKRVDTYYNYEEGDSHEIGIEAYIRKKGYTGYGYKDGAWIEGDYTYRQYASNFFAINLQDYSNTIPGYQKTGTTKICGKTCDVYSGTTSDTPKFVVYEGFREVGRSGEFAIWNGITMRITLEGTLQMEVLATSFDIPDEAFTQEIVEPTWIK